MYYVYLLESKKYRNKHYTGFTSDLVKRLKKHNNGEVKHTSKFKPWKLTVYLGFEDEQKALDFERYLKSHSGRAFIKKHF